MNQSEREKSELEKIVIRWCEARQCGQLHRVGPNGFEDKGVFHDGYPPSSTWEADRVHSALCRMSHDGSFPSKIAELLDYLFWEGHETITGFRLVGQGSPLRVKVPDLGGVSVEVSSLGFDPTKLLGGLLERFWRSLEKAIEECPKPEIAKEYETA